MFSVRGAITVEKDDPKEILDSAEELLAKMIEANSLIKKDIIAIIFSCTKDLRAAYPAKAARDMGIISAGLMCFQEMDVENSMEKCIRILLLSNGEREQETVRHVFLRDAVKLRLDLAR